MIFLRGNPIGVEQMAVSRTTEGWSILSTGRLAQPFDMVARKVEARYTADWKPIAFTIDSTVRGEFQRVITTIDGTTATSEITTGTQTTRKADTIDPSALLLPNVMYGPYEALAALLKTAADGSTLPAYQVPLGAGRTPRPRLDDRADPDAGAVDHGEAHAPDGEHDGSSRRHQHLGRRNRPAAAPHGSRAGTRRRAHRHRVGVGAAGRDLAAERRSGPHSRQRLLARGHGVEAGRSRRKGRSRP